MNNIDAANSAVNSPEQWDVAARMISEGVTEKDGRLYHDGKIVEPPLADIVARTRGFQCAERFVKHLQVEQGTTRSSYVSNGMSVGIDWEVNGKHATLVACVLFADRSETHTLSHQEAINIVRSAIDHTDYARVYHDMIS